MTTTLQNLPANAQRVTLSTREAALCSVYTYERDGETFAAGFLAGATEPSFQGHHVLSEEGLKETIAAFARHAQKRAGEMTPKQRIDHLHAMAKRPPPPPRGHGSVKVDGVRYHRQWAWSKAYEADFREAHRVSRARTHEDYEASARRYAEWLAERDGIDLSAARHAYFYWEYETYRSRKGQLRQRKSHIRTVVFQRSSLRNPYPGSEDNHVATIQIPNHDAKAWSVESVREPDDGEQPETLPETAPKTPKPKAKLPTGRQVAAAMGALIAWLETGDGDDSALEQARAMAARFQAA